MKRQRWKGRVIGMLIPALGIALNQQARAEDIVIFGSHNTIRAMLVVPEESRPVRAVLTHVAHHPLEPRPRWTELCRQLQWAHLVMTINLKESNRPRKLREALVPLLDDFARRLNMPELNHAYIATAGHSAGGMGVNAFLPLKDRFLTGAIDCSWILNYEKEAEETLQIPLLFTMGGIPDAFKMLEAIPNHYDPARAKGAFATLGIEWDKAHAFGNAGSLFVAWFLTIADLRLPSEPGPLRPINPTMTWLGDRGTWDTDDPKVYPANEFPGDPAQAVWLPDRRVAYVWRAYQSKSPPAELMVRQVGTETRLPDYKPATERQLITEMDAPLEFSLVGGNEETIAEVHYYAYDRVLGVVTERPWTATFSLPSGVYSVFAEVRLKNGNVFVTHPALLVLKKAGQTYKRIE